LESRRTRREGLIRFADRFEAVLETMTAAFINDTPNGANPGSTILSNRNALSAYCGNLVPLIAEFQADIEQSGHLGCVHAIFAR
jgi:hypothetical protein